MTQSRTPRLHSIAGDALSRVDGRQEIAQSEVTFTLRTDAAIERCLRALDASDLRLAHEPGKYDWKFAWVDPNRDGEGGRVRFGVAWYDQEFFTEKKDVYLDRRHVRMLAGFEADEEAVTVRHYTLHP
ncbi:hypothetical protein [Leifsonia virtsii]|uniref:Uncharacterized protein n=1 Tax=Leifsonia virtsii TaxID=3035915 RepID=A0ABT8IWN6_9MICO|nr:hypothetical protein [Leifsonia virtsii]MDN4597088.1 hypothetical protein [Leifsonia virtsii]